MPRDEFGTHIADLLNEMGPIGARRFFGGTGLYLGSAMFAMIIKDTLYLCADNEMRSAFEAQGAEPFRYRAKGREVTVARFHEVPAAMLDDQDALLLWAGHAVRAAARPAKSAHPRKSRAKPDK